MAGPNVRRMARATDGDQTPPAADEARPSEKATEPKKKGQKAKQAKIAAGLAVGLGKSGVRRLRTGKPEEDGGVVGRSAVQRQDELTALAGKIGASQARHKARSMFASAERKEQLDEEHMVRTAAQVKDAIGGMKGVVMKVAQMQSFTNEDMPDAWKEQLAQLQSAAPPMSGELAAGVVEQALGQRPEQLFAEWDPIPIGSASIGQVHRAITHDDVAVAVKVQYPAAADALSGDLANVGSLIEMIVRLAGDADAEGLNDARPIIDEMALRIGEEVDYAKEATNQQMFSAYFADHPFIHIPRVVTELSAATVLTTELVDGVKFAELETWPQTERDLAGETIFRFVQHSVFRMGSYNGDPHPGNYLFHPGGRVTFLDFGLVKTVDAPITALLSGVFAASVSEDDVVGFEAAMRAAGFIKPGISVDADLLFQHHGKRWRRMVADEVARMPWPSHRPVRDDDGKPIPHTEEEKALHRAVRMPPEFTMLMRLLEGMEAIVARLGSQRHWRAVAAQIWPFVAGPAATPLGELEAAWIAAKGTMAP